MGMSARCCAYHAAGRWLTENHYMRETAPNYDRAVSNVVRKIGRATRTQERITLGRIGKVVEAMDPDRASAVDEAVYLIRGHLVEHGEIVAPMAANETIEGTAAFYSRVKEGWERATDVPMTWGHADTEAQKIISQWDHTFIGDHYRDVVTERAEKVIRETIEEAGGAMSRREIGARLKTEMADVARPRNYWEIVAAQDISTARTWSSARFFREAEIEKYEVSAVGDERTCPICMFMDGQILEVEKTLEKLAEYKDAESAEDAKAVSGWLSTGVDEDGEVGIYSGETQLTGEMSGEDLQAMGVNAPSFHALCRCVIMAVL